jgi:hypothetical protein
VTRVSGVLLTILLSAGGVAGTVVAELETERGRFLREYWYEPGIEYGNPRFDGRFRVNAPEVVLDPRFMHRSEVRENGLMVILVEEDLARLEGAELFLEVWGGHPKSGEKRVTVNGRSTHVVPLDPSILRREPNRIELLSDTEHHGIEILLPGPALVVRNRPRDPGGTP